MKALRAAYLMLTNPHAVADPDGTIRLVDMAIKQGCSSLVGMFFHTICQDGTYKWQFKWQGWVVSTDGETALLQTLSWLDGEKHSIQPFPVSSLMNPDHARLYKTNEDMIYDHLKQKAKLGELVGSIEENMECHRRMNGIRR